MSFLAFKNIHSFLFCAWSQMLMVLQHECTFNVSVKYLIYSKKKQRFHR